MELILNIDTALEAACVSLADKSIVLASETNESQKDHAAWIQPAIQRLLQQAGRNVLDLKAVGVSIGPGSYTGLRIGLATAKGICYALDIPLIAINTLSLLAWDAIQKLKQGKIQAERAAKGAQQIENILFCPMVDARRMEVFTAIYDMHLREIVAPRATVLSVTSFGEMLERQKILFLGNGSEKFRHMCQNQGNAMFENFALDSFALADLTYSNFIGSNFAGLAYTEPLYLKEFFTQ